MKRVFTMVGLIFLGGAILSGEWTGKTYRKGGFVVVENYGKGLWGERITEKIRFVESFSVGREDGQDYEIFSAQILLAVSSGGEMAVFDRKQFKLRKYSKEGKFLWETGKKGEGPGEFKYPTGLSFSPEGEIWVVDYPKKIHRFSSEGKFKGVLKIEENVGNLFFLKNGRILGALFYSRGSGLRAAFFDRKMKKLADFPFQYSFGPKSPIGESFVEDKVIASGGEVIFALPDKYEVAVFSEDGSPLIKIIRKIHFKPTEIKIVGGGGISITTGDEVGPCFYFKNAYYVVQFGKIKVRGKEDYYENFLDFYTQEGKLLGSYPLPPETTLKWVDDESNFYFFQKEPFPRIYRARFVLRQP